MNDPKRIRINAIVSTVNSFPTLPTVVSRVIDITADPESDIVDLMKVIEIDQSLTASVLRIANSALYGVARNVSSLKEALTVLGFAEIQKIVLTKAVFESFKHLSKDARFEFRKFWEHSFYCGLASRIIAREVGSMFNEMFVAGIIHDIGKLILFIALEEDYVKIINYSKDTQKELHVVEDEVLGTNHSIVAMGLLRKWMFPENLLTAVGYHHYPEKGGKERNFALIVSLADRLAHVFTKRMGDQFPYNEEKILLSEKYKKQAFFIDLPFESRDIENYLGMIKDLREKDIEILNLFTS